MPEGEVEGEVDVASRRRRRREKRKRKNRKRERLMYNLKWVGGGVAVGLPIMALVLYLLWR